MRCLINLVRRASFKGKNETVLRRIFDESGPSVVRDCWPESGTWMGTPRVVFSRRDETQRVITNADMNQEKVLTEGPILAIIGELEWQACAVCAGVIAALHPSPFTLHSGTTVFLS